MAWILQKTGLKEVEWKRVPKLLSFGTRFKDHRSTIIQVKDLFAHCFYWTMDNDTANKQYLPTINIPLQVLLYDSQE